MLKFRQMAISDRQTLGRLIFQNLDAIEEGLEPVLSSVHPPQTTVPFILAREGSGRAVMIEYDIVANPIFLFHVIQHQDWFSNHLPLLSQLIPNGLLAPALSPRLLLILPEVPQEMERSLHLLNIQPECFIYAHLSVENQSGLWVRPYTFRTSPVRESSIPMEGSIHLTEEEKTFFNRTS